MSSQNSHVQVLTPGTQDVTLFGNQVTADVVSYNEVFRGGPNTIMSAVLIERGSLDTHTQTQKPRDVDREAEVRVMPKQCQRWPATTGRQERGLEQIPPHNL